MTRYHTEPRVAKLESGYYTAKVVDVQDLGLVKSTYAGETTERHKSVVVFEISDGNGGTVQAKKRINVSGDSRSTAWKINAALTGEETNDFDDADWFGKTCEVQVKVTKDANGNEWENIENVFPARE